MSSVNIIQTLKRELKAKAITYKDLAIYLKITEAGVKKLLSKDDIGLSKLKLICDLLQISLSDLISRAEETSSSGIVFSEKQINFFLKNKAYFHFFMKLAYEQKKPREIQTEFKLSPKSLNAYLKKLEELGLVKRHPYDRMQIIGGLALAVNTRGTELESLKYEIAAEQLHILSKKRSDALRGAGLFLTNLEKEEFLHRILNTVLDFSATSKLNRKKAHPQAAEFVFMSFLNEGSMFDKITDIVTN